MKRNKISKTQFFLFVCILIFSYYFIEDYATVNEVIKIYNLKQHGICILNNPKYIEDQEQLKQDVLKQLPEGYCFIDYKYTIENSALSTFHRDVTSSQYIYKTKNPVYTAIVYNYSGELLSFCLGSNYTYPFVWSRITNISGNKGTVFLFDCDLLHAGCDNHCLIKREVLQYKICHKDDIDKLHSLQGVNKIKIEKECVVSIYSSIIRKASYYFEMPINICMYPLMIKRENKNSFIGKIQEWLPNSFSFYNN